MLTPTELADARTNAAEIVAAFRAKAVEASNANGWTVEYAETVIFDYLRDIDPDTLQTLAVALAVTL